MTDTDVETAVQALACEPAARERLLAWAADPSTRNRARAAAWAMSQLPDARMGEPLTEDAVKLTRGDSAFALVIQDFAFRPDPCGAPEDVVRLGRALETAFGDWRFVLHIRRPVPAGFDPDAVARAVHLWRLALDRGDWRGRHAVYEDDAVSIDLSVTSREADRGKLLLLVPPIPAPDRLTEVYKRLLPAVLAVDERASIPTIAVLAADPGWQLPRGYVLELLYGVPDRIDTDSGLQEGTVGSTAESGEGSTTPYQAVYRPNGLALFSDPTCRNLGAVWWHDLGGGGIAHESPWCEAPVPRFPGRRFSPDVEPNGASPDGRRRAARMSLVPAASP